MASPELLFEVFFESSDDETDVSSTPTASSTSAAVDPVDRVVSSEEIARDIERLHSALEQQPYRASRADGLHELVERGDERWTHLSNGTHCAHSLHSSVQSILHPALIKGLLDKWPARVKWASKSALLKNYANLPVVATRLIAPGGMGKSQPVVVKLASYLAYCEQDKSDFPLYVFDHTLPSSVLQYDYTVPPIELFREDLFDPDRYPGLPRDALGVFNKTEWVILGPRRTSSPLHKDPQYTSAWNSLLCGRKYWAIFPPHVAEERLGKLSDLQSPLLWFLNVLPTLRGQPDLGLIEFIQEAGDTVFLPCEWWHAVLNLDEFNVAVTHNAVLPESLPHISERLKVSHPELAQRLGI